MNKRVLMHAALWLGIAFLSACIGGGSKASSITPLPSDGRTITSYSFASLPATGIINQAAKAISVNVPHGTDVTRLVATFETTGVSVMVGSTVQVSGSTPNDFTVPVYYVVTAQNGLSETYTVSVIVADGPSAQKAIIAFSFADPEAVGFIDQETGSISVSLPEGTDLSALVATFETTGTTVKIGSIEQVSGSTANDFTKPVLYTVTAEDSSTEIYTVLVSTGNYIHLESDPGDWIGMGLSHGYTQANAVIEVTETGNKLFIDVTGNQVWSGRFQVPDTVSGLQPGTYAATRVGMLDPAQSGMDWSGDGRGCSNTAGSFTIERVTYSQGKLAAIDLSFAQHCDVETPELRGRIHWSSGDTTTPPGPIEPPPVVLWQPAPGSTPATGNYIYLEGEPGDWVGYGYDYGYTQADARISVTADQRLLEVRIEGDQDWHGYFLTMNTLGQLQPGYYGSAQRYPFNNPTFGGMSWGGEARGCNTLSGWFVVDSITYTGGNLTAIDLRFEQHCEGMAPALHGKIHWRSDDPTTPPGPIDPPPSDIWQPAPGATPAGRNYVYLETTGTAAGEAYTFTQADAVLEVNATGGHVAVRVTGERDVYVDFETMYTLTSLQPGFYGNLMRWPFQNPARGGFDLGIDSGGCNRSMGWVVVDSVVYSGGDLAAIDLRFESSCEGLDFGWRGRIHWDVNDPTMPPGPIFPLPAGLWQPASGATPTTGNYVYLESEPGDWVGGGNTNLFTPDNAVFDVYPRDAYFGLMIGYREWYGNFEAMYNLTELQPGYYGNLKRWPFYNPTVGGMDWSGEFGSCYTLTGWFVVDHVVYAGGNLKEIDLRFEQYCEGSTSALHGKIHWVM